MSTDWKEIISEVIQDVITEKRLYENAIFLAPNFNKDGKITTYSICFWEKEYPEMKKETNAFDRNMVVVNIKDPGMAKRPETLKLTTISTEVKQPDDMEFIDNKSPYWLLPKGSDGFREYFKSLIEHAYDNYTGKTDAFGCCSKFTECSEAQKCLHSNQMYAKACMYRKNLEAGNIFYGSDVNEAGV